MPNMTLSIPENLMKKMRKFSEIRWSEVARKAMEQRVNDLEALEKLTSKSKLTKKDVIELGRKLKKATAEKFLKDAISN
jgi:hypothetical protein